MPAAKGDKETGHRFNKILAKFAAANDARTVIDQADFSDEEKLSFNATPLGEAVWGSI